MSYVQGTIVWFFKAASDPDITYEGSDPIAATVMDVHSETSADLRIMMSNTQPILRLSVPLADPDNRPARPYALLERIVEEA